MSSSEIVIVSSHEVLFKVVVAVVVVACHRFVAMLKPTKI